MLLVANVYLAINAMGALSEHASAKSVVHLIFLFFNWVVVLQPQ